MSDPSAAVERRSVPVRTILVTIGLLLATALLVYIVITVRQVLTWMVVALFFAVALSPAVDWVQRRLLRGRRRALATLIVFLLVFLALAALLTAFAVPIATEGTKLAGQLPQLINDARNGKGPVGQLLDRTHALQWVQTHQSTITNFAKGLTTPAVGVLAGVATGVTATITVFVLAYLMALEGPLVVDGFVALFRPETGERIRRVGADCARSVTGYITGNLLISVICGGLTYVVLLVMGVPFAGLVALFVGITDLVPLVGATIGGVVAGIAGFVHSVPAGLVVIAFFILYQQVENHLLQPVVFSRTVRLNPLTVLVSILIAAQLAGILGALLAIPVASIIQVIVRDLWDNRRGRPKEEPTVGEERAPADGEPPGPPPGAAAPAAVSDLTSGGGSAGGGGASSSA